MGYADVQCQCDKLGPTKKFLVGCGFFGQNRFSPLKFTAEWQRCLVIVWRECSMSECGAAGSEMVERTFILMVAVMSLAHQWWLWTQRNWDNWFWKTGRSQFDIIFCYFGVVCENYAQYYNSQISAAGELLNSCQVGTYVSVCLEIMLKIKDISVV